MLGVAAGSERYPGRAVLVRSAALASGLGMVQYAGPVSVRHHMPSALPEVMAGPDTQGKARAWVVDSRLGSGDEARSRLTEAIGNLRRRGTAARPGRLGAGPGGPRGRGPAPGRLISRDTEAHAGELARLVGRRLVRGAVHADGTTADLVASAQGQPPPTVGNITAAAWLQGMGGARTAVDGPFGASTLAAAVRPVMVRDG